MIHLVLGGARSGKSRFALEQVMHLSASSNLPVTFVATAMASDPEMAQRIAYHEAERPNHWRLAEVPLDLNLLLAETEFLPKQILLIDCLTLWLNNQLFEYPEQNFKTLFSELLSALQACKCDIFLVLLSPDSVNSEWILPEIGAAWALNKLIVPIVTQTGLS